MVRVGSAASRQPVPGGQTGLVVLTMRTPALSVTVEGCWGEMGEGWWRKARALRRDSLRKLGWTWTPSQVVSCS